jgi:parvulin-like peptidyl-prolyl isomerase
MIPAVEVDGTQIDLADVLRRARWRAQARFQARFMEEAADAFFIRREAGRRGLNVSPAELQQAADDFRRAHKLHEVWSTERWLAANHLTREDWELMLEEDLLTFKLREVLTTSQVEKYFAENRLSFDSATISHIVVPDAEAAKELRAQIVEEGAYFYALARRHSQDAGTRPAGGYLGKVKRAELEAAMEAAVFSARGGDVVGPFKTEAGWRLVRIEALHPGRLDEVTSEEIKSWLFNEWLNEQHRKSETRMQV